MIKFRAIATILAALGMTGVAYRYLQDDIDLSFGFEEDEEENV